MTRPAYIIAARRSAVAPKGGAFKALGVHELAAPILTACLADAGLATDQVDEVILANALYAGGNPARLAALAAGLPVTVAGLSVDRQCVGGLDAILLAADMVASGRADAVLAGGAESVSRAPIRMRTDPDGGSPVAYDRPPFAPAPFADPDMHQAAAELAQTQGISTATQVDWTINSHASALAAAETLKSEIVAVGDPVLSTDSYTRRLSAALCKRSPVLAGSVLNATTAVNADAAAFALVVSADVAQRLSPSAAIRIDGGATVGADTALPGLAPVAAIRMALQRCGTSIGNVDVAEVMEAYAAQAIACVTQSGLNPEAVNRGGGALARGHPIGASGAILAVRLFHEMSRRGGQTGLATIAAAGGLGTALILARD